MNRVKLIEAIAQPQDLDAVKDSLAEIGITRLTVTDVRGRGKGRDLESEDGGMLRKLKLLIAVNEESVDPVLTALAAVRSKEQSGGTPRIRAHVLPLGDCIRIRTGERGVEAI